MWCDATTRGLFGRDLATPSFVSADVCPVCANGGGDHALLFDPKLGVLALRTADWTAYAITPLARPTTPPRIDAGTPSSKTANHAVPGWTTRPTMRPTTPPTSAALTAPTDAHVRISGHARGLVIDLMVRGQKYAASPKDAS